MSDVNLTQVIGELSRALKTDAGYWMSWQANIAMSIYDACVLEGIKHPELHAACNAGAGHFLRLLTTDVAKETP
jgi:predicted nucleic acid-binding protein